MDRAKEILKASEEEESRFGDTETIGAAFYSGALWADLHPESQWKCIKDVKPPKGELVLMFFGHDYENDFGYHLAEYIENSYPGADPWWKMDLDWLPSDGTEYWRPIPKIPKEQLYQ